MQLLKRKRKPIKPDSKVYMPLKKSTQKNIPKRKQNPFRKTQKKVPSRPNRKGFRLSHVSIYAFLGLIFIALLYFSVRYINNLRNSDEQELSVEYVQGLTDIPTYPGSSFIFLNSMDQDSVKNFLSNGNSAYRLPNNTDIKKVFDYYSETLPTKGWSFVQQVELESEDREYGQYWTKDNTGLRIYSKFNDVWYETLTSTEAQTGLADRVKQKNDMNLLLVDNESQDLLPDFPWILQIPKEYLISYKVSFFDDKLQQVNMSKIGAEEKISIVPICKVSEHPLDYCLDDYVASLGTTDNTKWHVINTFVIATNLGSSLKGTIGNGGSTDQIYVIPNSYNNVVYAIDCNTSESPFLEYIIENIKPQNTKKY